MKSMSKEERVLYLKALARKLEYVIDSNGDFGGLRDNSYHELCYSEFRAKQYLNWYWTPKILYIPFQYKGEEMYIVTEQIITKRLV